MLLTPTENLSVIEQKQQDNMSKLLKHIIKYKKAITIAECAKVLNVSFPTATNLIEDLCEKNILIKEGKNDASLGRKANAYSIDKKAGYFIGVEIKQYNLSMGCIDINKEWVMKPIQVDFFLNNSPECLQQLIEHINNFIKDNHIELNKVLGICVISPGRINTINGDNMNYFTFLNEHLDFHLTKELKCFTMIDNDTRANAIGEYYIENKYTEKNLLYINVDYGLGMSLIIDGQVFYGKNGYAGEVGHTFFADNNVLCHCGKTGCLETEVSGRALFRIVKEQLLQGKASQLNITEQITLENIIQAVLNNDSLVVSLVEKMGYQLGLIIANLINIFNPEVVIIGGVLAKTKDYLVLPIKTTIRKYCLKSVAEETRVVIANDNVYAGVYGACLLALEKRLC